MSKGYPDYFGFPMFPTLGNYTQQYVYKANKSDSVISMFDLQSKGITQGGYIYFTGVEDPVNVKMGITIDGYRFIDEAINNLMTFSQIHNDNGLIGLTKFSPSEELFNCVFSSGITFKDQYKLDIINPMNYIITIGSSLFYSIIL